MAQTCRRESEADYHAKRTRDHRFRHESAMYRQLAEKPKMSSVNKTSSTWQPSARGANSIEDRLTGG